MNGTYPDKFRKETLKRFEARKVQFILGDRIDEVDVDAANGLRTVKGRTVDADLVVSGICVIVIRVSTRLDSYPWRAP